MEYRFFILKPIASSFDETLQPHLLSGELKMFLKRIPIAIVLIAVFAQPTLADVTVIKGFSIRPVGASPVGDNGNIYKLEILSLIHI